MNMKQPISGIKKSLGSCSGFSLFEVVICVGIFGIILTSVLAFFGNALALNELSRNLHTATTHAQYILEDIRNSTYSTVPTQVSTGVWDWDAAALTLRGLAPLKNESITVTSAGTTLLTLEVTVTWDESNGRHRSIVLTTQTGGA